jgi:hypothetical protein
MPIFVYSHHPILPPAGRLHRNHTPIVAEFDDRHPAAYNACTASDASNTTHPSAIPANLYRQRFSASRRNHSCDGRLAPGAARRALCGRAGWRDRRPPLHRRRHRTRRSGSCGHGRSALRDDSSRHAYGLTVCAPYVQVSGQPVSAGAAGCSPVRLPQPADAPGGCHRHRRQDDDQQSALPPAARGRPAPRHDQHRRRLHQRRGVGYRAARHHARCARRAALPGADGRGRLPGRCAGDHIARPASGTCGCGRFRRGGGDQRDP